MSYNLSTLQILLTNAGLPVLSVQFNPSASKPLSPTFSTYAAPDGVTTVGMDWSTPYTAQQNTTAAGIVAAGNYSGTQLLNGVVLGQKINQLSAAAYNLAWGQISTVVPPATLPPYLLGSGPGQWFIYLIYGQNSTNLTKLLQIQIMEFWTYNYPTWLIAPSWDTTGTINISGYDQST